jgi:hypothetical protein
MFVRAFFFFFWGAMGHFEWPIAKNILNLNSPLPLPKKRK